MAKGKKPGRKSRRKVGRPTQYRPGFVQVATDLYSGGATDIEVADALGIAIRTLYGWQHKHPEFLQAARVAKDVADARVERSLYNRAVGYTFDSVKIMQDKGRPVVVPYREHVPPDPGAGFNWLKNRRPEEWRDRRELTGANGGPLVVERVYFGQNPDTE